MKVNSGKKAVTKGKTGERDFINTVNRLSDGKIQLKRNLTQTRSGGDDIEPYQNISFEIKRWKKVSDSLVRDWWRQCHRNAKQAGKIPVLAYRADMQSWHIMLHPCLFFEQSDVNGCLTMSIEFFVKHLLNPDCLKNYDEKKSNS